LKNQDYIKKGKIDSLLTYPPDPLPLTREGGVLRREGFHPSLKTLPPLLRGEGDKGGKVKILS
jgi:hypothetical protein